jgi:hypothetical protein
MPAFTLAGLIRMILTTSVHDFLFSVSLAKLQSLTSFAAWASSVKRGQRINATSGNRLPSAQTDLQRGKFTARAYFSNTSVAHSLMYSLRMLRHHV